jgi:hypothetical protein
MTYTQACPYIISALLGAISGEIFVMVAAKAIPTLLTNIMSGMMGKMKDQMAACGCNPNEICQQMMGFVKGQKESCLLDIPFILS